MCIPTMCILEARLPFAIIFPVGAQNDELRGWERGEVRKP